jgi:hypothetical protein
MDGTDLVKELWSIANIITGFSAVQSLGFALAVCKDLGGLQRQPAPVKGLLIILCVIFAGFFSWGVFRCYDLAMRVDGAYDPIWLQVTYGRVICILLFTAFPVFALFAANTSGRHSA